MKLITTTENLAEMFGIVVKAIPTRPSHPILANVLVDADADKQQVTFTAFDLALGIKACVPAQVEEGGKTTIPGKMVNDLLSRLDDGDVHLEEISANLFQFSLAGSEYQVRGLDAEGYTDLPEIEAIPFEFPIEALLDGLHGSIFAASSDDTKGALTGVHLTVYPLGVEFAATDGHRLSVVWHNLKQDDTTESNAPAAPPANAAQPTTDEENPPEALFFVTIPAKALQELKNLIDKTGGSADGVLMYMERSQVAFVWGSQKVTARVIEGDYPEYRKLFPKSFLRNLVVDRRLFLGALERISVMADQHNNIVKLILSPQAQEMAIAVDAKDVGSGKETLSVQLTGDPLEIAFNIKYLIEFLKNAATTEVKMELNTPTSPCVLTLMGGINQKYLLMPVQVRS